MAAEGCRAAVLDRRHDLELAEADMAGIGRTPCRPVVAEDIRDLQRRTGHRRGRLRRRLVFLVAVLDLLWCLALWPRQAVKRALHLGDHAGGNMGIARRRFQFGMAQQRLKGSDVGVVLEQVGGEAVAQRVQRHALLGPGRLGGLAEQAAQLAGRHWRPRFAAGKQKLLLKWQQVRIVTAARLPPLPQQAEHLVRQHHIAVLAALRLLDANDILGAVDMLDLEPHDLARPQSAAIAETEQNRLAAIASSRLISSALITSASFSGSRMW